MAGRGQKFRFHGAFTKKASAKRKEHGVGGFIRRVKIGSKFRYVVMTAK